MARVNVDDLIQRMLEHSDKYPELKVYADGLKEVYRMEKEIERTEPKKTKELTKPAVEPTINTVRPQGRVTEQDILAQLGVGV